MREQEVRELYEAYLQVHQPQEEVEQLDEGYQRNPEKDPDYVPSGERPTRRQRMNDPNTGINSRAFHDFMTQQTGGTKKKKVKEETDLFDTILEHLVAEGYADTNEAALAIMANMSEEWRQSILMNEGVLGAVGKVVGGVVKKVGNYLNSPSDDPDLKRDPSYNPRTGRGDYKDPRKQPPRAGEVRTY